MYSFLFHPVLVNIFITVNNNYFNFTYVITTFTKLVIATRYDNNKKNVATFCYNCMTEREIIET